MALNDLSESGSDSPSIPSYLVGADNHNIGNSMGGSWFDPSTYPDKFENAGKFIAASVLSGADSLYNSAVTVGNWFGAEAQLSDTNAWITSLDQDLGQYYSENRQAADLAGFVATSFIPGIAGVKVLNAGQKALISAKNGGLLGANLSKYTGILAPSTETYVKLAGAEIKSAQTSFNILNANTAKALTSGFWQNTLEAAAFETFVQASMFKSPILEEQDHWDIAKNILMGAAIGGTIGGALESARTLSSIKRARVEEDIRIKPYTSRETVQEGTSPSDRIILAAENRETTPLPKADALPENPSAADLKLFEAQEANARVAAQRKSKQVDLDNHVAIREMSSNVSDDVVNAVAETQYGMDTATAMKNWYGAVEVTAPTATTKLEKEAIQNLTEGFQSRYITLAGEGAGSVSFELPAVLSVADRLSIKGGKIADAVKGAVKDAGFSLKNLWNPASAFGKLSWREAELRHIWADQVGKIPENISIHANDIPLLERMIRKEGRTDFKLILDEKKVSEGITFPTIQDAEKFLIERKETLANELLGKRLSKLNAETDPIETTTAAIAKVVNVKQSYLEGTRNTLKPSSDLYAWQALSEEMHAAKVAKGIKNPLDAVEPSYFQPKVAKINYQLTDNLAVDGHVLDGLAFITARQKALQQAADNVVAKQAGDLSERMVPIGEEQLARTNSYGAGPGMVTSAQSKYGSVESIVQYVGGVAKDLGAKIRTEVNDVMQSALYHLGQNQKAAIEWDAINNQLARTTEHYVIDTENALGYGANALVPKKYMKALKDAGEEGDVTFPALQPGAPEFIKVENYETLAAITQSQSLTARRTENAKERWAAQGKVHDYDSDVVRPIRPNPKDFPHFAFVSDPRVTGSGHVSMLFANTEKELQDLVAKTNREFPEFKVILKKDTEDWFRARGSYDSDLGLNENYIDSSMKAKGIYSNFYTRSDPQAIANDILQYHYRSAGLEANEIVRLKYSAAFNWLENQAESYSALEASKFSNSRYDRISENEKNPYISYIKTALNLASTPTSNPWWSLNRFIDQQVSKGVGRIRQVWDSAKSVDDLAEVNAMMSHYGSQTAFNSASEIALINHTAPKAELSKFVRSANAIMSRFTLGLDPLNALNNAIGANVLRGTELTQITKAIREGNTELAGQLGELAKVRIPGAPDDIISAPKLIASSISRFFKDTDNVLLKEYKAAGFIKDRLEQFKSIADDLTLRGTETVGDLSSRVTGAFSKAKALADAGEKYSGNNFAEEFNRFISADVIRQITDLGQAHGILSQKEALTYINNFVNRVEGNTIASQRPGLFQGPLGQAVGLFQSYQFNLLQQLFRYVAEGDKKDLGMLLGLQGTFYGLQGEPGFKFLNDHVVGTASGNQNHRDMYDAVRGVTGKQAGDWLLYGTASNIMQTNIYSRGDINPRNVTLIPTSIADVPFVGGMGKVFGSLYETTKKIANGGAVWESIRQGIEHNGISRPLAGLAQTSRAIDNQGTVFSTSSKGSILGSNDLFGLATISRLAGGRPLDEAILNDTMFSINSYEAFDRAKKNELAETVKSTVIGKNKSPSADELTTFAEHYAYLGGKQGSFAKYMMEQYTKANTSSAELMFQKLNNPLAYKVQTLMGGTPN